MKREDTEISLYNPFKNSTEKNPYVFEDKPVGLRKFAVVNIVGEKFHQKHDGKKCMMKVKVSTISYDKARVRGRVRCWPCIAPWERRLIACASCAIVCGACERGVRLRI